MANSLFVLLFSVLHPFYISVTSIEHKKNDKILEISCRIFFDDLEDALSKKYGHRFSLMKPTNRSIVDKYLADYLKKNLAITTDGKAQELRYIGYEIEEDAAWCYLQINAVESVKKLTINNSILYQSHHQQSNILHVTVDNNRKSTKLDYPQTNAEFKF
ncbi:MAG TPA: DUF6702 family protein [Pseudosphingobacterium sp.]|nr:DUF6702 family protein [Pseudosphingobacterium sp.]